MKYLLSRNMFYSFVLIFLPVLAAVSWINVQLNNVSPDLLFAIVTYIFPALLVSYGIALLASDALNASYKFTLPRVSFALTCYSLALLLLSKGFSYFGFHTQFVTLNLAGIANPQEQAAVFYSIQLMVGMIHMVIFYSIAVYAFGEKSFAELFPMKRMRGKLRKAFLLAS